MKRRWIISLMLVWIVKGFGAIDELVRFLNQLPLESAVGAKTLTLGAQRAFVGAFTNPYYLIFQTDNPDRYKNDSRAHHNIGEY